MWDVFSNQIGVSRFSDTSVWWMVVLCPSLTGIRFQVKLLHLLLVPNLSPNTIQTGNTLHPRKLRWNLKMNRWNMRFLLGNIIFRFHVSFRGSVLFSLTNRGNARVYQHSSFKDTKTMLLRIEMRKIQADPSWSWPNCSSICRNFSSLDAWFEKKTHGTQDLLMSGCHWPGWEYKRYIWYIQ